MIILEFSVAVDVMAMCCCSTVVSAELSKQKMYVPRYAMRSWQMVDVVVPTQIVSIRSVKDESELESDSLEAKKGTRSHCYNPKGAEQDHQSVSFHTRASAWTCISIRLILVHRNASQ